MAAESKYLWSKFLNKPINSEEGEGEKPETNAFWKPFCRI